MYDKLNQYLAKKGSKTKAESNATKTETVKAEFKTKEKTKALSTAERLDRIEKLLGLQ